MSQVCAFTSPSSVSVSFYEMVIKAKADVAALLDLFSDVRVRSDGDLQGCQGRPEGGVHPDP
jgi:hypothetical protein